MRGTTEHRQNPEVDHLARAHSLLATAAEGVKNLKRESNEAIRRYFALMGMLARLRQLTASPKPEAGGEAALYAAALCREALALLQDMDSRGRRGPDVRPVARVRQKPSASAKAGSGADGSANGVR
jgi:hypothetical protein